MKRKSIKLRDCNGTYMKLMISIGNTNKI